MSNYTELRDALYNCAHKSDYGCQKCKYHGHDNCEKKVLMDAYEMLGSAVGRLEALKKFLQEKDILT